MDPLAIISGTITIVESILSTYNTIRHLQGLPKAFEEVGQNLPLAKETLQLARRQLKRANPDEPEKRAIEPVIRGCQQKVEALNDILKKIENSKDQEGDAQHWSTLAGFYHRVVVPMGKAYRVENLMGDIMDKLKALAIHQMFKAATQGQIEKLEKAIKELSEVEPSLPDSEFEIGGGNVNQNISDQGRGFVSKGGYVDNTMGNKFSAAKDMNFEATSTPLRFEEIQHEMFQISRMAPGAGTWLVESPEFIEWRDGKLQKLWYYGIAGVGKTVLASIIINHLHTRYSANTDVACIYVYFDYRKHQTQSLADIFSSLLVQLLRGGNYVANEIQEVYETWGVTHLHPGLEEYLKMLKSQAKRFQKVYMIVDALDECCGDTKKNTMNSFLRACQELPENVYMLFTSRPGLNSRLVKPDREFEITANAIDIKSYLNKSIESHPNLRAIIETGLKTDIAFRCRTFLLAHLHMEFLASKLTLGAFEHGLTQLSSTPNEVYDAALERITGQNEDRRQLAIRVITWIVFAERALTVTELIHALAIQDAASQIESSKRVIPKASATSETEWALTSACAGIVVGVVENDTGFLRLAHGSAEEYLRNGQSILFQDSQSTLAETCLHCLTNVPTKYSQVTADDFSQDYPFFRYAATYWGKHLSLKVKGSTYKLAWEFLADKRLLNRSVRAIDDSKICQERDVSGMHVAAYFGLVHLVRKAMGFRKRLDINARTQRNETPLHWAAAYRQREFLEFLVIQDADLNATNVDNRTPLHIAMMNEDTMSVSLLLATKRVNLELPDSQGYTPLTRAAFQGQLSMVEKLLKAGAAVDAHDKDDWTALRWAAQKGYKMIARLLINHGASIEPPSSDNWTLLRWAATYNRGDVITLLSEMRVDMNATDADGLTALRWAVSHDQAMTTWLLIQARADINKRDKKWVTPLHAVAERCHQSNSSNHILWLLLENHANVNAQTKNHGLTPLHMAASGGNDSAVWLLLEKGADPSKLDVNSRTALHCAVGSDNLRVAQLLIWRASGLVNAFDHEKRTVLHYAASQGNRSIVEMLLNSGADIDAQDGSGQTPLSLAVSQSHEDVAVCLIRSGANLDMPCKKKRPVVYLDKLAASMGNAVIVNAIRQARAE
ncbi:hypothetical protein AK830_g10674 [Neonectria ditissima]|uniref:Uncharacterized protein n=1 Tax=Neonectria ditissima TaxID=78410 RepID=A0A0P7AF69_9HYPO|nr:hypothetical protein AK830_g10674 [Neonectria ditissima]